MAESPAQKNRDQDLDEALGESFPASDPPAMTEPKPAKSPPRAKPAGGKAAAQKPRPRAPPQTGTVAPSTRPRPLSW
jgi:hypothetical protein